MIKYDFLLKTYDSYSLTKEVVLDISIRFVKEPFFLIFEWTTNVQNYCVIYGCFDLPSKRT